MSFARQNPIAFTLATLTAASTLAFIVTNDSQTLGLAVLLGVLTGFAWPIHDQFMPDATGE